MKKLACVFATVVLVAACQPEKSANQSASLATAAPAAASGDTGLDSAIAEPVAFTPIGHPRGSCMTEDEIAAEQAIRLHTAMMVTGLTCHGFYREPTLFNRYQEFTVEHQDKLGSAQDTIALFLSRYNSGNRDRLYDTYQTEVANAESRLVANASAPTYCRLRRDQYYTATEFTRSDFDTFVEIMVDQHRNSYEMCR